MTRYLDKSYVAGAWQANKGEAFASIDARTLEELGTFHTASKALADSAVSGAIDAYAQIRELPGHQVSDLLEALATELECDRGRLLEIADQETALGETRLSGELGRTCNQLRAFAALTRDGHWVRASIDNADPARTPPKPDLRRMLRPIGPVLVFPASNFPLAFGVLGGDTASALAAGNPVIIKAHPAHPATSELCMQAAEKALQACELPGSLISMLQGNSLELGEHLVQHPGICAVGFTGSLRGGRSIMDLAAKRPVPIPVYAEMGSVNPLFITPAALAARGEQIAAGIASSVSLGTGQFCTSPGLIVGLSDEGFISELAKQLQRAPQGNLLHPSIAAGLRNSMHCALENPDLTLVTGGECRDDSGMQPSNTLLRASSGALLNNRALQDEIFGPVAIYISCEQAADMFLVADQIEGNLTSTIHCEKNDAAAPDLALRLAERSGRVIFNGYPTGVEVCPSQQHGGPYPACSQASTTSVGTDAISRFARFVAWQDAPQSLLPAALRDDNPHDILRLEDGQFKMHNKNH